MFTAQEAQNITNAVLEYHLKGQPESQIIQDRPLYNAMMSNKKTFGGGKEIIDGAVKGLYSSAYRGYSHDDQVGFVNPANIKRWQARWYEMHAGLEITNTELKQNGIHVVDTNTGERTSNASDQEKYALCNLLDDKMEDLMEGSRRSHAEIMWRDGSQDAKVYPGILSFILDSPATGVTFGIDRAANSWWRNRASVAIDSSTASNQNLVNTLQFEIRQLRRYGSPKHRAFAGSLFMDAFEKELRNKGNYTLDGWAKSGKIDASVADLAFKGIEIEYDPLLDDLSRNKYCYFLDMKAIKLGPMEAEEEKMHYPSRPHDQFVLFRSITWTGCMWANRLNTTGVYAVL